MRTCSRRGSVACRVNYWPNSPQGVVRWTKWTVPGANTTRCATRKMLSLIALSVGLLLPAGGGLTRRDALAAVAATPALLARPAAAPAATSAVPTKDMESIKALTYVLTVSTTKLGSGGQVAY